MMTLSKKGDLLAELKYGRVSVVITQLSISQLETEFHNSL